MLWQTWTGVFWNETTIQDKTYMHFDKFLWWFCFTTRTVRERNGRLCISAAATSSSSSSSALLCMSYGVSSRKRGKHGRICISITDASRGEKKGKFLLMLHRKTEYAVRTLGTRLLWWKGYKKWQKYFPPLHPVSCSWRIPCEGRKILPSLLLFLLP